MIVKMLLHKMSQYREILMFFQVWLLLVRWVSQQLERNFAVEGSELMKREYLPDDKQLQACRNTI